LALLFVFGRVRKRHQEKTLTAKGAKRNRKYAKQSLVIFRKHVAGLSDTALAELVARAGRAVRLRGSVNVLVTSSRELRSLNRRFRGKDQPTDVLSFPPGPGFGNVLAGDIAISAEIAKQNARRLGHSAAEEIKILAVHGVLHLAGYDHERDDGKMAGKETKLRQFLGLPAGLIERNGQSGIPNRNGFLGGAQRKAAGGGARATRAAELRSARTGRRPVPTRTRARTQARTR
jgi:probable rRNA maturation factor